LNAIDVGIVVFALALATLGFERGLVASALPLAGFVGGAALGARLGPALLADGSESQYAPVVSVGAGILLGAFCAVALDGVARMVHDRLRRGAVLRALDSVGGATLLAALAMLMAWAFGAVALHTPGPNGRSLREAVQRSTILAALNDALPPSGPLLNVLRRVDPRPAVRGPDAGVRAPAGTIVDDPDVVAAGESTVKVLGTACGLGVAGSGWVAGPGLVVTNAHVVAGEDDTEVELAGDRLAADPVHYDPRNDLGILRVDGVTAPPLELEARLRRGAEAAAIGYPENGPLTLTPARLGLTAEVTSEDSYGRGPVRRSMTAFRGRVRSGNSGGPVVDADGEVLATVFAAAFDGGPPSVLGVPNEVVASALSGPLRSTDTGPCAA
jgi:S1-C subfamily serine protease